MSKKTKKIVILTEVELRKTISRLTSEIIEKVKKLDNLLLVGIPTRGIELTEVLEKELFSRTGLRVRKGTIDPTFYRDDQNRVCLLYTSPSPRDLSTSRMPSSA